ncbi:MAG: queuosine precursor transporter [Flavobacteriaceae bacterium]|nr:queuosine precursor transporter [Flavobacteriaceae bacterium]
MKASDKVFAEKIYLFLSTLFITSLVVSNIIFQKFFYWYPLDFSLLGQPLFEISVGLLPYPLTFLITDLISEIYGKRRANIIVVIGIFASFFSAGILLLGNALPAVDYSPINDSLYEKVFALSPIAALASMIAYLIAQFVDIRIYHFWKKLTKGKMLWLRNNLSTFTSQFLDSVTVVGLLCSFKVLNWDNFWGLSMASFIFKIMIAIVDTPFLYIFVHLFRKRFSLKIGQEIDWNTNDE